MAIGMQYKAKEPRLHRCFMTTQSASLYFLYAGPPDFELHPYAFNTFVWRTIRRTGAAHAGSHLYRLRLLSLRSHGRLCARMHTSLKELDMVEPLIGLVAAILLGVYLVYTLLHPEKF
jgi:K+-transporting ATPase KdpF subunit